MKYRSIVFALGLVVTPTLGDEVLYRYEGDVLPYDASAGWLVYNPCDDECNELVENGHFVLFWPQAGDSANYSHWIAQPPEPPPHALG